MKTVVINICKLSHSNIKLAFRMSCVNINSKVINMTVIERYKTILRNPKNITNLVYRLPVNFV